MNTQDARRRDVDAAAEFLAAEPTRITRAFQQHRNNGRDFCIAHQRDVPWPCLLWWIARRAQLLVNAPQIPRPREAS